MITEKRWKLQLSAKNRRKYTEEKSRESGLLIKEKLQNSKRYWVLSGIINYLVRFMCVYFCVMGTVECYMSAFNVEYARSLVYIVMLPITALFVLLQYSVSTSAFSMLLAFVVVRHVFMYYTDVVKSGLVAIVNISYGLVRQKFVLPEVDGFPETIINRDLTINTVVMCGCILLVMMFAVLIVRHMSAIIIMLVTMGVAGLGMFFGGMPSATAIIMLLISWVIMMALKFNAKVNIGIKKDSCEVLVKKDGFVLGQGIDGLAMLQLAIITTLVVIVGVSAINAVYPRTEFEQNIVDSSIKQKADRMVKDIMIMGFSRYKKYGVTVKVSSGQLGNYSNVQPDFMTDINVKMAQYTSERVYLRGYVGTNYENNSWTRAEQDYRRPFNAFNMTAEAIKDGGGAHAKMEINPVDITGDYRFAPYYTEATIDTNIEKDMIMENTVVGESYTDEFYIDDGTNAEVDDEEYYDYVKKYCLDVPKGNRKKIEKLIEQKGFEADDPLVDEKIAQMFNDEYEYSLTPGLVPWNTDFVNYFLFDNKVGCCAHFASSATLIYRTMGVPARYVEGYVIDSQNATYAPKLSDEDIANWIEGMVPMGEVSSIDVNDSAAHAWVEVYKKGYGWVPVEVTPPDYSPENESEDTEGFAEGLTKLLEGLGNGEGIDQLYSRLFGENGIDTTGFKNGIKILLGAILGIYILLNLGGRLIFKIRANGKNICKNISLKYQKTLDMLKYTGVEEVAAYRDFGDIVHSIGALDEESAMNAVRYIEKALFGNKELDKGEYLAIKSAFSTIDSWCFKNMKIRKKIKFLLKIYF